MFSFPTHPIAIGVSDGVQAAFNYLQASWRRWLPVVIVVAVVTGIAYAALGSPDTTGLYYIDRSTGQLTWYAGSDVRLWHVGGDLSVTGLVGLIASWVFTAAAIAGLRGRPMTLDFILVRGLMSLVASILLLFALIAAVIALVILVVAVPPLGVLGLFAAIPVLLYLVIRVVFYTLAIFDGFGPIEGISESWRLSRGAVVRLFGWGLLAILISLGFSIVSSIVGALFTGSTVAVGRGVEAVVTTTGSCFTVFMMAVLYESERARHDPAAYGIAAGPGYPPPYPGAPYPYGPGRYPGGPAQYPGAPAWPNTGPYAGASMPYPGQVAPYPGGPMPYPGAPMPYPGQVTPYPGEPAPYAGPQAPYPGGPMPYPGQVTPYPGSTPPYATAPSWPADPQPNQPISGWTVPQGTPVWPSAQQPAPTWPPQNPVLPYQGATPAYPGTQPPRWDPAAGTWTAPATGEVAPATTSEAPAEPSSADVTLSPEDPNTPA